MPPRIPERMGWQIVGLRHAGFTQNEITRDLNIRQGTVSKIIGRHSQRRTVKPKASFVGHESRQHEMIELCIAFVQVTE